MTEPGLTTANPAPASARPPALRQRIERHLLLSLVLIWALGCAVMVTMGNHFIAAAFDRSLLNDAHALASHVRGGGQQPLYLDLTPREVNILTFDQRDPISFAVYNQNQQRITGEAHLQPDAVSLTASHAFSTTTHDGVELRRVSLLISEAPSFTVVMAQTTRGRSELLRKLLLYSGLAQAWLLIVLSLWLLRGIERDLRPLSDLQDAMAQRDAADLRPLPRTLTTDATTRDVQLLGEALDLLLNRVRSSLQAQQEFAGNVAHELRTPLAGIRAQAAHALAHENPQVWHHELEGIAAAEQRASRTVEQLLALARATEGSAALALGPMALDAVVRNTMLRFLPQADALGVDLGAEGIDHPVMVMGNTGLTEGILNNLLTNALRYGLGSPPRVTVQVRQASPWVVLCVTDNGPGLDSHTPQPLPQRWKHERPAPGPNQGAGLGLAIITRYAALMNGRLELLPGDDGCGLTAQVWLHESGPAASSLSPRADEAAPPPHANGAFDSRSR